MHGYKQLLRVKTVYWIHQNRHQTRRKNVNNFTKFFAIDILNALHISIDVIQSQNSDSGIMSAEQYTSSMEEFSDLPDISGGKYALCIRF